MENITKQFALTDVQWAYLIGRSNEFEAGNVATHYYNELLNNIDIQRFETALNIVIGRHSMLHTIVESSGRQYTLNNWKYYKIKVHDLRNASKEDKEKFLLSRRTVLSHYVYQAGVWPMFTFEVALLEDNQKYMFISIDLLIADAGSISILFNELCEFYENPESTRMPPKIEFYDFVQYIEKNRVGRKYQDDCLYWNRQITDMPLGPKLPVRKDYSGTTHKFKRFMHIFSQKEWQERKKEIGRIGLVPTTYLCECYREILAYWSGEEDFSLNLTMSNRNRLRGCEQVIGDFTSLMILPIIGTEDKGADFLNRAKSLQNKFIEIYSHSSYDGIKVVRDVVKYHDLKHSIAFPVVFTSLMGGSEENFNDSFFGKSQYSLSQTPQVYLDCQVSEENDTLIITWDYAESKYEANMIRQMFEQFISLVGRNKNDTFMLSEIFSNKSVELLSALEKYNRSEENYPSASLRDIILEACSRYKNSVAIRDGDRIYTYKEIDKESEKYADYLINYGIRRGDRVGVKGKREADTLFKIIGIIKADAVYVPIHPEYPDERIEFMLKDSGCRIYFGEEIEEVSSRSVNLDSPNEPAYIIYTSGSTGKPKGVIIDHHAVSNTLYDINHKFHIGENDNIFNVSDYGFDLSVYDIFGTFLAGAGVVIGHDVRDIAKLNSEMENGQVTVWNSVPAIFELLLDYRKGREKNYRLNYVLLSGDWIPMYIAEQMSEAFPNAKLISLGGATEASIWSIYHPVRGIRKGWKSIPYGIPLGNQHCYVLDQFLTPSPFDVPGEIYIGGVGVAAGYTEKIQTEKSFIMHEKFGRLYRTGDKGAFRKEGYIDILGRIDFQVKINGYRVECSEIENELEKNESVSRAFVEFLNREQKTQLIAYIVPSKDEQIVINRSQTFLTAASQAAKQLPKEFYNEESEKLDRQMERISLENMRRVIMELCMESGLDDSFTEEEFLAAAKTKKTYDKALHQWLLVLRNNQYLEYDNTKYKLPDSSQIRSAEWIEVQFSKIIKEFGSNEYQRKNIQFFMNCMLYTKQILTNEQNVTELLFPNGDWDVARSLYHDNPRAKFNNAIIAKTILAYIKQNAPLSISILEVGAGIGGTTESVLEKISNRNVTYTYTDLSAFFTEQAKKKFAGYDFMKYGIYNLDIEPQCQGFELESYDIILAANVVHDASDALLSLKNLKHLLKPGGIIILLEVSQDSYTFMTTIELLEGFSSYNDFRVANGTAIMSVKQWENLFNKAGFEHFSSYPGEETSIGENVMVGIKDGRSHFLKSELTALKGQLQENLPAYMIPRNIIQIEKVPLGNNGKVDRKKLPEYRDMSTHTKIIVKPGTKIQKELFQAWTDILGYDGFGITDDFFDIGGDSLLMIKQIAGLEKNYSYKISSREFMENPTIEKMSQYIMKEGII